MAQVQQDAAECDNSNYRKPKGSRNHLQLLALVDSRNRQNL